MRQEVAVVKIQEKIRDLRKDFMGRTGALVWFPPMVYLLVLPLIHV